MRLFSLLLVGALLIALVAPFFIKGPTGRPLMSADDVFADVVPARPQALYRWQDEHGTWQFGEAPPASATVEVTQLTLDTSRTTTMGSEWDVSALVDAPVIGNAGEAIGTGPGFSVPDSPFAAYRAAPELMNAAQDARRALDARQSDLDKLLTGALGDSER